MTREKIGEGESRRRGMQTVYIGTTYASERTLLSKNGEMNVAGVNCKKKTLNLIALNASRLEDGGVESAEKFLYTSAEEPDLNWLKEETKSSSRRSATKE
ncbi:MAG: hypothetical protein FRX48_04814 [Lasallia pustulata]|uniref:Uncharacterized protein n=1 Tax=Lasallia pustulata TaxID=136370 RepID=A0A5M8PPW1_9LECA|nr:MAG: hypothetical protein FRX48_04814 [Lasallia pustulata]